MSVGPLVPALAQQVRHVVHERVDQSAGGSTCAICALHSLRTNARVIGLAFQRDDFCSRTTKWARLQPVAVVNQLVHAILSARLAGSN